MQRVTFEGETLQEINTLVGQFHAGKNALCGVDTDPKAICADTLVSTCDQELAAKRLVQSADPTPPPPNEKEVQSPPNEKEVQSPAGNNLVDSKGVPWDERIHASSKKTVADGSWRYKRGVHKNEIATVEAELQATMAAPEQTSAPTPPAPAPAPEQTSAPTPPAPAPEQTSAPTPPAPAQEQTSEPTPPAPAQDVPQDFSQLMQLVGSVLTNPAKMTVEQLEEIANEFELPTYVMLNNRQDLIPAYAARMLAVINA